MERRLWLRTAAAALFALVTFNWRRLNAADVTDLKDKLIVGLRPQLPAHREFIDRVVELVEQDQLPLDVVMMYFQWARKKKYRPMPYFERALRAEAERRGAVI